MVCLHEDVVDGFGPHERAEGGIHLVVLVVGIQRPLFGRLELRCLQILIFFRVLTGLYRDVNRARIDNLGHDPHPNAVPA